MGPSERPQNDMKGDAFIFVDEKHPSYTAVKEGAQREAADRHEEELVAAVKKLALVQSNPAPSSKPKKKKKKNNKKAKAKVENERVGKDESGGEGESVVGKEETKEA